MHDSNKPHGCTSDSNKPHRSLIWLAHFPNKPNLLNKATGCYIPQSRVLTWALISHSHLKTFYVSRRMNLIKSSQTMKNLKRRSKVTEIFRTLSTYEYANLKDTNISIAHLVAVIFLKSRFSILELEFTCMLKKNVKTNEICNIKYLYSPWL